MSFFPKEPKKIRARIRRYERELRKERDKFGYIGDGYGKRYLLGPLYLLMGDVEGAVKSFEWFEQTFPDDIGEPIHFLCWTLVVYRLIPQPPFIPPAKNLPATASNVGTHGLHCTSVSLRRFKGWAVSSALTII